MGRIEYARDHRLHAEDVADDLCDHQNDVVFIGGGEQAVRLLYAGLAQD